MRSLLKKWDFTKKRSQILLIATVRILFLAIALVTVLVTQGDGRENLQFLLPIYILLGTAFFIHTLYLFLFDLLLKYWFIPAVLFAFDIILVSGLIFYSGIEQSFFLFMYLFNIVVCGFVYQRSGAFLLAILSSTLLSVTLFFDPQLSGKALILTLAVNNISFFAVAWLSGYLSEQMDFMGKELRLRRRDLNTLKSINNLIVDYIPVGLVTTLSSGEIIRANRVADEILQTRRDLVGANFYEIFPNIKNQIADLKREGIQGGLRLDVEYHYSEKEKILLGMTISPLEDEGDIQGMIVIFDDLTKFRELEFAMRQSEKMAAVGQLAAGIAHEIRNPLASISGSVQMLQGTNLSESDAKLMAIVIKETDRLNELITEFLEYVRPEKKPETPVDLSIVLNEILDFLQMDQKIRGDVEQRRKLAANSMIHGNRDKLRQAFLNMIINAYQAMRKTEKPLLRVEIRETEERVIVEIEDSGEGMSERERARIFEPFHTTKHDGTGLGLAVSHKILEAHEAQIFVESQKGEGTLFILDFPKPPSKPT